MLTCENNTSMTDSTTQANRFTNRLAREASPYLLQHAENPVEWYPWGEEALSQAKAEDKPILLSIGYSAFARDKASSPQGYHSTRFSACCRR